MAKKDIRTIKQLSSVTNISTVTLGRILNNKQKNVSYVTLVRLARGLECEVADLVEVEEVV